MAGFADDANGFDVVYGNNVDFSGGATPSAQILSNGQLLIGSTALPHIQVGTITSSNNTVTVGYSSPNINLTAGGAVATTYNENSGAATPSANILSVPGNNTANNGFATWTTGAGNTLTVNSYGHTKWVVNPTAGVGTHTTIASALTSSASGDTIYITPGTYTENLTLKAGVDLVAFDANASLNATGSVIISGNATLSTAGSVSISGIQLQTNSAALITVSGSAASIVNIMQCNINCTNNTGITFSSSSASAQVNIFNCTGDLGTTGIGLFAHSSAGSMTIRFSIFTNSGASTTASTISAGSLICNFSTFSSPITSSSTSSAVLDRCTIDCGPQNATTFTCGGSGNNHCDWSYFASGTASAISIGATLGLHGCQISSSNTNAITGAGTINYDGLLFTSTSSTINTTTQTTVGTLKGSTNTGPSAGFLGQQITANAGSVSLSNNTAKTITSATLTAGIWDLSGMCFFNATGNTSQCEAGFNTTTDTFPAGNAGQDFAYFNPTSAAPYAMTLTLPPKRIVLTTSTTYYLVGLIVFTTGAPTSNAYMTATRVA